MIGLAGTVVGLFMLVYGSNLLVDGAAGLAAKRGINPHIIGMTLVATATSLPELATSVTATIAGEHGIAVGNVVGSNAFNVGIVLAAGALFLHVVPNRLVLRDGWILIISTVIFSYMALFGITRLDALLLLVLYTAYTVQLFKVSKETMELRVQERPYSVLLLLLFIGTLLLVVGAPVIVGSATRLADAIGIRSSIIGLSLIAFGTSLPELITTITAALKKQQGIAVGNVFGSNLFNILLIPGIAGLIHPLGISRYMSGSVVPAMLLVTLLGVVLTRKRMDRFGSALLILSYAAFFFLIFAEGF